MEWAPWIDLPVREISIVPHRGIPGRSSGTDKLTFGLICEEAVDLGDGTVEGHNVEAVIGGVENQVLAHDGQANEAKVTSGHLVSMRNIGEPARGATDVNGGKAHTGGLRRRVVMSKPVASGLAGLGGKEQEATEKEGSDGGGVGLLTRGEENENLRWGAHLEGSSMEEGRRGERDAKRKKILGLMKLRSGRMSWDGEGGGGEEEEGWGGFRGGKRIGGGRRLGRNRGAGV